MKAMKRRWLILLLILLPLVLLFIAAEFALHSPRVFAYLVRQADVRAGASFDVQSSQGSLSGPMVLSGIKLKLPGWAVNIRRLELRWQPLALLNRQLSVQALKLTGLSVIALPVAQPAAKSSGLPAPPRLPLAISLQQLIIDDLRYQAQGQAQPTVVPHIALTVQTQGQRVMIGRFEVAHPQLALQSSGSLWLTGHYPLHLQANVDLRPSGYAPAQLALQARGDLDRLQLQLDGAAPYAAHLQAELEQPLADLHWHAIFTSTGLRLPDLATNLPPLQLAGQLEGHGDKRSGELLTQLDLQYPQLPKLHLALQGGFQDTLVHVRQLRVTRPGQPGYVQAQGQLSLAQPAQPAGRLDLNWEQLDWPGIPASSRRGRGWVAGTAEHYSLQTHADLHLAAPQALDVQLELMAGGDRNALNISRLQAHLLQGEVTAQGQLQWRDGLRWQARLQGRDLDPAQLAAQWPGKLDFALTTQGQRSGQVVRITGDLARLQGTLRGYPITAQGGFIWSPELLEVDQLQAQVARSRIRADGRIGEYVELTARLNSPDLSQLLPQLGGRADVNVSARGSRATPNLHVQAHASQLRYQDNQLAGLQADADVYLDDRQPSDITIHLTDGMLAGQAIQAGAMHVAGRLQDHRLSLDLHTPKGDAVLTAQGALALQERLWQGELAQAQLSLPGPLPPWRLRQTAQLSISQQAAVLGSSCWQSAEANLCLQAFWHHIDGWRAQFQLDHFQLAQLQGLAVQKVTLEGYISAQGELGSNPKQGLTGWLTGISDQGRIRRAPEEGTPAVLLDYQGAHLNLTAAANGLRADLGAHLGAEGQISGNLALPGYNGQLAQIWDSPLKADLRLDTTNLGLLPLALPEIAALEGRLEVDLQASGRLRQPVFAGGVRLDRGSFEVPRYGLRVTQVHLSAHAEQRDRIAWQAQASSGGGRMRADGNFAYRNGVPEVDAHLLGTLFQVVSDEEAEVYVSPDLHFGLKGKAAKLTGILNVPKARLTPHDLNQTVSATPDQVLINTGQPTQSPGLTVTSQVRINIGDQVRFRGFGLKGRIGGSLQVSDGPDQVTTGSGELRILDGEYRAYGQDLTIETGRLLFTGGPVDNPGLDMRATRKLADIEVGATVRGSLRQPQLSLFSDPPMGQSEILSYLVTGRPLNQLSNNEGADVANAATSLGLTGGEFLAQRIGARFGLEDVRIENSGSVETSSLIMGRYLSPRVYVSYGIGVFTAMPSFRVQYRIDQHWTLKTTASNESSIDLIYTIER